MPPSETLTFPPTPALSPYLPPSSPPSTSSTKPFITLTYATSLDASLSLAPGTQTKLSGPLSKAMTHHLRAHHDAILVGVGTAVADDPGLNCRIEGAGAERQPRPVVVDPRGRWEWWRGARCVEAAREGGAKAKGPWVVVGKGMGREGLEEVGGRVVEVETDGEGRMEWREVFGALGRLGVGSVMVEGGAGVINALLAPENAGLVDSVIVTVAPTWLGEGGVVVAPPRRWGGEGRAVPVARLRDVRWVPLGEDVVLCGRLARDE